MRLGAAIAIARNLPNSVGKTLVNVTSGLLCLDFFVAQAYSAYSVRRGPICVTTWSSLACCLGCDVVPVRLRAVKPLLDSSATTLAAIFEIAHTFSTARAFFDQCVFRSSHTGALART